MIFLKRLSFGILILFLAAAVVFGPQARASLDEALAGTGYIAKGLCSGVLMGEMDPDLLMEQEFATGAGVVDWEIDEVEEEVEVSALFGLIKARARRHQGLGCSRILESHEWLPLPAVSRPLSFDPPEAGAPWKIAPFGSDAPPTGVDRDALEAALDEAFSESDPSNPRRTRAVVVVHDGWVVSERYSAGVQPSTPLLGWSMTKSISHALIGIAVGDGLMEPSDPIPVPEWSAGDDPRAAITLDQALRMSSGLAFEEAYSDFGSDVVRMLMIEYDAGGVAADQPLEAEPGTRWHYSSGTTNLISRTLRQVMGDDPLYWAFPYERLFAPLGMHSAILETDPSGTFIGSSYGYASARDWARFGLFYLNDGVWDGRRILPEGWVRYGVSPTPGAPNREYGAHWWLNAGGRFEGVPPDEFRASGFEGQYVMVIPSRNTVIVRLGQTPGGGFDSVAFEKAILAALPSPVGRE
jgi:CubicO group peptidase (beta-lactamase class C family)